MSSRHDSPKVGRFNRWIITVSTLITAVLGLAQLAVLIGWLPLG